MMKRGIMVALLAASSAILLTNQGCKDAGVGDPCIPDIEYDATFSGFTEDTVRTESKSFQCQTRLCLVNHFRGRVSCPQGQDAQGNGPDGGPGCFLPGFEGSEDPAHKVAPQAKEPQANCVAAQCEDRKAADTVYCSCRCANADGRTDDGAVYCGCPDGFSCEQLVAQVGATNQGLTGAYCVKNNTQFDASNNCSVTLDPADPNKCATVK